MSDFFTDEQNLAELVSHMPEEDAHRFNKFGHFRVEAVFIDRLFIVYKPTGLTASGQHNPPEILNLLKVVDFGVDPREGAYSVLKEQNTGQELTLTYVPKRVFSYPVYASLPAKLTLRWDGRMVGDRVWRSLAFAYLIKTKNKSSFYSKGNVYMETPNVFRRLYPSVTGEFKF
jgi:hypothetical protein